MTLDEVIKNCENVAKIQRDYVKSGCCCDDTEMEDNCLRCAVENEQLAEWLTELRHLKNIMAYLNNTIDMFCTKNGEEIYSFTNVQMWAEDELRVMRESD